MKKKKNLIKKLKKIVSERINMELLELSEVLYRTDIQRLKEENKKIKRRIQLMEIDNRKIEKLDRELEQFVNKTGFNIKGQYLKE